MRTIAEIAGSAVKRATAGELQSVPTAGVFAAPAMHEAPAMWLRRIWERMTALYGHAWVSVLGVTPHDNAEGLSMAGDTWSRALAGLSGRQIAAGIEACIAEGAEFPPSAPRFRAMCLGVPSLAAVRSELRHGDPSQFARAVRAELDDFRYKQASADQGDRMLRDAYDLVHERVMRGESLPEAPVAEIPHEKHEYKPASEEVKDREKAKIRALLGMGAA